MNTYNKNNRLSRMVHNFGLATVSAALLLGATAAFADPSYNMAPPVASSDQDGGSQAPDSVFNFTDVPENQRVPVDHATFDQGGYQIYDTSGETIVVPFKDQNLYAMKFARSDDDTMYFINEGGVPVLYVPDGGYLNNATVSGARWYPFPQNYHPTGAVYVGPAPSWDLFIGMGWYPGMHYYGGYWCDRPYWGGGIFVAFPGLCFEIGGHPYWGWDNYHSYYVGHPGWFHPGFYNRDIYHWAGHPSFSRPPFGSVDHHGFGGGGDGHFGDGHPEFRGTGHPGGGGNDGFHGGSPGFHGDSDHTFRGGGDPGFRGGSSSGGYHTFHGADGGGGGSFGGGHDFHGDDHTFHGNSGGGDHSFGGDDHTFRGNNDGGNHNFGGGNSGGNHNFSGGNGGNNHNFSGGNGGSHNFGGGNGGNNGGHSGGGDHSFHGGDDHSHDH